MDCQFFYSRKIRYKQKKIYLIKLRTIKNDSKDIKKINFTRFGKFFRRSGLDEIFQLFNILKGDISFVGPRPLYTKYDSLYNQDQSLRLTVKPGLTGLAQIHQKNTTTWEEKINYDLIYIEKKSFLFDLKIFFKTFLILFNRLFDKEFITVSEEFTGKKLKIKNNFLSKWPNYDQNELKLVTSIIKSGKVNYWTGTYGKLFEKKYSTFHKIKHCVSVNSGTSALECAIKALNLKKNSEIITTPRSYYTSASSIILCGHKPKFSDISINTQNLDPKILKKNFKKKLKQ